MSAAELLSHPWLKGSLESLDILKNGNINGELTVRIDKCLSSVPNFELALELIEEKQNCRSFILHSNFLRIFKLEAEKRS